MNKEELSKQRKEQAEDLQKKALRRFRERKDT
jgi:hypothetical protein